MNVRIVQGENTWILRRICESIRLPSFSVSSEASRGADVNFYVNYVCFSDPFEDSVHVPWFTHLASKRDDGGFRRKRFFNRAERADHCIAMCQHTANELLRVRDKEDVSVWGGAPDPRFLKPHIIVGAACKISRRKRVDKLEAIKGIPGVDVRVTGGKLSMDQLVKWFKQLDYLVVTSDTEGGPYSVIEAIAAGVPVIAPDVGWCWEYPVIRYDGTTEGLVNTIRKLRPPPDPWGAASVELETILRRAMKRKFENSE